MFARKNPSSSWLDRLRSNKGIPTTHDLNLDQFLAQIPNSPDSPKQNPNPPPPEPDPKWLNSISSALADLFVMEEETGDGLNPTKFRKKAARKQPNPKIFIKAEERAAEGKEVEEKLDLAGYSRSDLVIIDTSNGGAGWKMEKSVYRKGSVWKVREKKWKGRSVAVGRKKRKFSKVDEGSEDEKKRKKKKKWMKKKMKQRVGVVKKGGGDEHGDHRFQVCVDNTKQVPNKAIQQNLQISMKRCKLFKPPQRLAKRSSVFGTQDTPSCMENAVPLQ